MSLEHKTESVFQRNEATGIIYKSRVQPCTPSTSPGIGSPRSAIVRLKEEKQYKKDRRKPLTPRFIIARLVNGREHRRCSDIHERENGVNPESCRNYPDGPMMATGLNDPNYRGPAV